MGTAKNSRNLLRELTSAGWRVEAKVGEVGRLWNDCLCAKRPFMPQHATTKLAVDRQFEPG